MLGGGNPVGSSNPSGTSASLNIVGKHAYFAPTAIPAQTTSIVTGKFSTGAYYVVGTFTLSAGIQITNPADVDGAACQIEFNGEVVMLLATAGGAIDAPLMAQTDLLIPPFTDVIVTTRSSSDDANNFITTSYVGEVYA